MRSTTTVQMTAVRPGRTVRMPDCLVTEEPMEIRAAGPGQPAESVAVTMRTPGHDFELAAGFLFTEGLAGADEIRTVRYCAPAGQAQEYNVVTVDLRVPFAGTGARAFCTTSACGTCGKATLDQVEVRVPPLPPAPDGFVTSELIALLPDRLRDAQALFSQTGGLHAAGLFTPTGEAELVREDVGRHNAVDKVIGATVLARRGPLEQRVLMVSGRVSFEIVQKAAMAGIPVLCAVSAPSSLAVDAAQRFGVTLAAFVRGDRCNLYTYPERVAVV